MGFYDDLAFEVKLGAIKSAGGKVKAQRFLKSVRKGARHLKASGGRSGSRSSSRHASSNFQRRVIVKVSIVKMDTKGAGAQRLHLKYIERDGTGPNGEPGQLFNGRDKQVDKETFVERGKDDRHQFRIIVSPEDAGDLADLTAYTSDLVAEMETDLGTRLDWVGVNHYDTGQPHTHLVINGKRDDGTDLVIPRKYISHGIRERAQGLVELELGPVPEIEGRNRLARTVSQERLTEIDRGLFRNVKDDILDLSAPARKGLHWKKQLARMRLKQLSNMGLAEPLGKGRWLIAKDTEMTLRQMGERDDIIKTMHRALKEKHIARTMDASSIYSHTQTDAQNVTGKIIDKGIADDVKGRAYIIVDSLAGKPLYVEVGGVERLPEFSKGQIATISAPKIEPKQSDRTIAKIAKDNDGNYSNILHMETDTSARPEFVEAHVRRLEALRRAGHATRLSDGLWQIPPDYLARVTDYERARAVHLPPDITVKSRLTLGQMKTAHGVTWLDEHMRDFTGNETAQGFAREVETARAARHRFLVEQGYIRYGQTRLTDKDIATLLARDLSDAGDEVAAKLGKPYRAAQRSGRIKGVYRSTIDRPSGKFAVIENSKEFSLVPWRDVMDRNLGRSISGIVRGNQISWTLSKGRSVS